MKRSKFIIISLLCLFLLSGCAVEKGALPGPEDLELVRERGIPALSREDSLSMINLMAENRALELEGSLYSFAFDGDYRPVLARWTLEEGSLSGGEILAEGCLPQCLSLLYGKLYYINGQAGNSIERLDLTDGSRETLKAGPCRWLQIRDGKLYYKGPSGGFFSAEPDGSGEQAIIEEECFYPCLLGEAVLYQRGSDQRLCLLWLEDSSLAELTDHEAYSPLIWGERLYYSTDSGLRALSLDGQESLIFDLPDIQAAAELFPRGEELFIRAVADENGPRQWSAQAEPGAEPEYSELQGYRLLAYSGETLTIDTVYVPGGRVLSFSLQPEEGQALEYLRVAP